MAKQSEAKTCGIYIVTTKGGRYSSHHLAAASPEDAIKRTGEKASRIKSVELCKLNPGPFATMRELRIATCAHEWEETIDGDLGCPHCGGSKRRPRRSW